MPYRTLDALARNDAVDLRLRALYAALSVVVGSVLLALSSKVQIPFWPVPLNMQTFVVLCLGFVYGPALGVVTVAAFLAQGLMGLPVFSQGGGPGYLAGPTGGYLVAYLGAVYLVGWLAQRGWSQRLLPAISAGVLAHALIYALGVSWLAVYLGDFAAAVSAGLLPFLLGDGLKILAAAAVATGLQLLGRRRNTA